MNDTVLQLTDVHKSYRLGRPNEVKVLRGVRLEIRAGEIVGLLAPSGAGKTTLLFVAGLIELADSGEIAVAGEILTNASDHRRTRARRRDIGIVYQHHHLLPEFSALENVMIPQIAAGISRTDAARRAAQLLESVGLRRRQGHRPAELSGGEQQRVAICRAFANDPGIILADEPTGNLDVETAEQVFLLMLTRVRDAGKAALVATHNLDLADKMDRVIYLHHGRVEERVVEERNALTTRLDAEAKASIKSSLGYPDLPTG
ncbi:MAG: ABC transporter ATP-binding protein [Rhodobacteraceae bacterium]|nr:ABC transporter ATP-binding protein [Paracoccaceae bacterium]